MSSDRKIITAGNYTTSSTSFVDIDATNFSITLNTGNSRILIAISAEAYTDAAAEIYLDLLIDGVRQGGTSGLIGKHSNLSSANLSFAYLTAVLGSGNHAIKPQWRVSASTGNLRADTAVNPLVLYAVEEVTVSQVYVSEIIRQVEYLELENLLPQTCSLIPRVRLRRLDDLIQVMELTGYEFLRYTKVWQGIGEFELLINGQSEKALEMIDKGVVGNIGSPSSINNFILEVSYDGVSDFAGIIDFPSVEWMDDGTEMLRLVGPDLKRWLADRIIVPPTGLEYDSYAGLQETIIKSMIDRHLINPIATDALGFNDAQRAIDYLIVSTDLLRGSATTFEGRGQSLFSAVSEVANFANEFGFDFYIQNDQVVFDLFDGEDRSDYVVFDIALGNVSNFKSEWDGMNFASHALLAGQGEGVARTMRTAQTSPQTYTGPRRREVFQDARDLDTEAKLLDRGTAVIRDRSRILRLSAEKIQSLGPCYKDNFNLGDIVTVRNSKYNVSQSVKIYEVQVIHKAHQAPEVLLTWNAPVAQSALKLIRADIAPGSSRT